MYDFKERVVLITGASGNLGSAAARAFLAGGAKLILADRNLDNLNRVFADLGDSGEVMFLTVDLTDGGAVESAIFEAVQQFGRLDVLVNVAGGYRAGTPLHETPLEHWDFLLNLNMKTVINTGRGAIPHMLQQKYGKIINIAARAALEGKANMAAYVVSKAAVVRMTESMAAELKEQGINVNAILPGTIDTPQNRAATPTADFSKWVAPEALAEVILFLASDASRAIHGAAIPVYGLS